MLLALGICSNRRSQSRYQRKEVVQRYWTRLQDPFRSHKRHLHWSAHWNLRTKSKGWCVWFIADKKCPFTGEVSIRGRILTGKVISTKMTRTVIIRRDYLHYIPKYRVYKQYLFYHIKLTTVSLLDRYEKRHKNLAAHVSPAFRVELGDVVTVGRFIFPLIRVNWAHCRAIGQCRPLSKTVRFNVIRVAKNKAAAKTFGKF